jgi:hypothetical protein
MHYRKHAVRTAKPGRFEADHAELNQGEMHLNVFRWKEKYLWSIYNVKIKHCKLLVVVVTTTLHTTWIKEEQMFVWKELNKT